jgi:subtilisin-like proprotein convertase family protein
MSLKKFLMGGCALALATGTALAQPTPEIDEGTLANNTYFNTVSAIDAGAGVRVTWVKFTIAGVNRAAGDYLDIDTTSGTLTGADSMIGLYDDAGNRIAFDDDDGPALWSSLTFGDNINTRPAIGTGAIHNGRDGADLAPGTYWLGITGFSGTTFGLTGWNITSTHSRVGTVDYRIEYFRGTDPSNPNGVGIATPATARNDQNTFVTFQVSVVPGANPTSEAHTVTLDASSVGLSSSISMTEFSPGVFQYSDTVSSGFGAGTYQLPFTVQETAPQSRTGFGQITFNIINPPSGACCTEDGCFFITEADCTFAGGTYIGDGVACSGCTCQSPTTPENDFCSGAILMSIGDFVNGNTCSATPNPEAGVCSGQTLSSGGLWYKVIGNGNTLTADTCSSSGALYDTRLSVYCGDCSASPMTCVGGNDDSCGLRSSVTFCTQEGATYYILVHGFSAGRGDFTLTVQDSFTPCTPTVLCIPTGACCLDSGCEILTAAQCDDRGGSYLGDAAPCGEFTYGSPIASQDSFPISIPDSVGGVPGFASATISVSEGGTVEGIQVCIGLTHTFSADLIVTISNGTNFARLMNRQGGGNDLGGTYCFSTDATTTLPLINPIPSGTYQSFDSLAVFAGDSTDGVWTLEVTDNAGLDIGTIDSLSIQFGNFNSACGGGCPACAADFNEDGGVDGQDVEAFFTVWETGEACGDVNEDGGVDGGDIEFFFTLWEQGGC